ncbi:Por secretion system C-terminal sorting domain-containing protein [Chitinophaga sp. YR573]|uniref:T9SS type A sorting domain-containing protein n=1 Tax=Chitinophaga sp. YR573 TaxID=1881040 RepID=UPI0008BF55D7|nr:T9SS type A sorting domain-containing protein [Chitinophaga sp. YR573]SEW45069.1 Por secretion system C-terminal sorting domain-containing protein [Chitinophaga sp. YR573]
MKLYITVSHLLSHRAFFCRSVSLLLTSLLLFLYSHAQVTLSANGPGNTYELIESVLGSGTTGEVPDCSHPSFGRHITEVFDTDLNKNVFIFHIHTTPDDDRCGTNTDRQRNEIKTFGSSPDNVKAANGETVTYRWKFKIDAGFIPTSGFCHLHQIKAGDGDDGAPLITLTPRAGSPQKLQLIYTPGSGLSGAGEKANANLSLFKGTWVEVVEKIKYTSTGTYQITIKKVSDGTTLLSYTNNNIDMWRSGTTFCRPKWGIYRKLVDGMRDEQVRFADFCIAEGSATCGSTTVLTTPTIAAADNKVDASAPVAVNIYPNPFQQLTTIDLQLKEAGTSTIEVFDMQQKRVAMVLNSSLSPGSHRTSLDTKNLPTGSYVVKISHNGKTYTKIITKQ